MASGTFGIASTDDSTKNFRGEEILLVLDDEVTVDFKSPLQLNSSINLPRVELQSGMAYRIDPRK